MVYEKLDVLELDNNKNYIVAEIIKDQGETYLYLANEDGSKDYILVKVDSEDNKNFTEVVNEEEFKKIGNLIQEKNKDLINLLLNDKNEK